MRNNLAVAFLALLGSANGQWKAQRHFEEGGTSVNPVYRQTRQLEQYYSAYRNELKIAKKKFQEFFLFSPTQNYEINFPFMLGLNLILDLKFGLSMKFRVD